MNRRDFLDPASLAESAGQVLGMLDAGQPAAASEVALVRAARRAMACTFEVLLPFGTPESLEVVEAALDLIDRLEDQLTVYHDNSEVSRLNRNAAREPVTIDDRLFELLQLAQHLHVETQGAFDITAGALSKAWGFYRRQGRVPTPEEIAEAQQRVGMGHVQLDVDRRSVRFDVPGLEINLGSIGKGYALDRVAEVLRQQRGLDSALLHGGLSSMLAIGAMPGVPRGWPVAIRHPHDRDCLLATVHLRDQGLATSGAIHQHVEHEGRKLGHILDPRSGWPAEGIACASAIAPTAALADALSTAFFILGVEGTQAYCQAHSGVAAVLLPEGAAAPIFIKSGPLVAADYACAKTRP